MTKAYVVLPNLHTDPAPMTDVDAFYPVRLE